MEYQARLDRLSGFVGRWRPGEVAMRCLLKSFLRRRRCSPSRRSTRRSLRPRARRRGGRRAKDDDVGSIDGMIGPTTPSSLAPRAPRWSRDRTLYIPDMRFVAAEEREGPARAAIMSHSNSWTSDASMVARGSTARDPPRHAAIQKHCPYSRRTRRGRRRTARSWRAASTASALLGRQALVDRVGDLGRAARQPSRGLLP
jgi:hypothetical protein